MNRQIFTKPGIWAGGYFGISLELGRRSDERLQEATVALWGHQSLQGCYTERDLEPEQQEIISPGRSDTKLEGWLYGVASTPNGKMIPCGTTTVRYTRSGDESGNDWLNLDIPMEGLGTAYPVDAYPFESHAPLDWREEVNEWMREIGTHVFSQVPFLFGIVGWEAPMFDESAAWIESEGVPDSRVDSYLIPQPDGLHWYAANEGYPVRTVP